MRAAVVTLTMAKTMPPASRNASPSATASSATLPPSGELTGLRRSGGAGRSASGFAFAATGTGAFGVISVLAGLPIGTLAAGFALGGDVFDIVAVAVSDLVGMAAAWMLGAAPAATGLAAGAIGCAAKLCMQIRHSTGVPAAISMPKVNVEPQCGQTSCVLELAMVRRASLDESADLI